MRGSNPRMTILDDEFDMAKKLKPIPHFKSEAAERRFWETHDSTDYIDWSKAKHINFPNLKPSTTSVAQRDSTKKLSSRKK